MDIFINTTLAKLEKNRNKLIELERYSYRFTAEELAERLKVLIGTKKQNKKAKVNILLKEESDRYLINIGNISYYLRDFLYGEIQQEEVKEIDFDSIKNIKKNITLLVGGTGTGKTYKAINENSNFVVAVPTRQLAYEIVMDYGNKIDAVYTGEIHLDGNKNCVCVYENLDEKIIDKYETLIIDEAHFLNDKDRGGYLLSHIVDAVKKNKKIILMTATDTISKELKRALNINTIKLKAFKKVKKIEIDTNKLKELIKEGKKVLVFTKYAPTARDVEYYSLAFGVDIDKADYISANRTTSERLETQIKFKRGDLQLVISSNVLAQGVNFPADCVVVEYNKYDDWELVQQKIGRAGRPQFTDKAYYVLYNNPTKELKRGKPTKIITRYVKFYRGIDIEDGKFQQFEIPQFNQKQGFEYRDIKYSKRLLEYLESKKKITKVEKKALEYIKEEELRVATIIKKYKSNT